MLMTEAIIRRKKSHFAKMGLSFLILSITSIQLYSAVLIGTCKAVETPLCKLPVEPALYPFLDYPMYSVVWQEGDLVQQHQLIAIFLDGTERQLHAEDFGLSPYWFKGSLVPAFKRKNMSKIPDYLKAYDQQGHQPFVAFRVDVFPTKVSEKGLENKAKITGEPVSLITGAK